MNDDDNGEDGFGALFWLFLALGIVGILGFFGTAAVAVGF